MALWKGDERECTTISFPTTLRRRETVVSCQLMRAGAHQRQPEVQPARQGRPTKWEDSVAGRLPSAPVTSHKSLPSVRIVPISNIITTSSARLPTSSPTILFYSSIIYFFALLNYQVSNKLFIHLKFYVTIVRVTLWICDNQLSSSVELSATSKY